MKIRIACCDDEKEQLQQYKKLFANFEVRYEVDLEVEYFLNGEFLLERFQREKYPFDLVFLDMEMPHMSGLEVAREIRRSGGGDVLILFLTSFPEYMQESFDVRAFQYMIKPVALEEFERKLKSAMEYLARDEKNIIVLKTESEDIILRTEEIYYFEKEKSARRFQVHLENEMLSARGNMNDLEEQLKEMHFIRTHRSLLVNMKHIKRIRKSEMVLSNEEIIPVSRRKELEIKQQFMKYAILERGK